MRHSGAVCVRVRLAGPADFVFLAEMLVAAAFWRPDGPAGSVREVLERPELAHYVAGWPLPGDLGVVAADGEQLLGAAWLRLLPEHNPGYGFVDGATPELSIGVVQSHRGHGVGSCLLDGLLAAASENGVHAISLSVDRENGASRLYERLGFQQVGTVDSSLTMLLQL